jgi:hypothetical protein
VWFIAYAIICLLAGEYFGHLMASSNDHSLYPAHAHLQLLGAVVSFLFGVAHRLYPALGKTRLALAQFLVWIVMIPVFTYGIIHALLTNEKEPQWAIAGEILAIIGTLLFAIMFAGKALFAKAEA